MFGIVLLVNIHRFERTRTMQYEIVELPGRTIVGPTIRTSNNSPEEVAAIGQLWEGRCACRDKHVGKANRACTT